MKNKKDIIEEFKNKVLNFKIDKDKKIMQMAVI